LTEKTEKTSNWTKLETLVQLGILIFAMIAVYYSVSASNTANNIAQTSLKLSNYNMTIITYINRANLDAFDYLGNSSTNLLSNSGTLNLSLIVITPHATILNISFPQWRMTFTRVNDTYPISTASEGEVYLPILDPHEFNRSMLSIGSTAIENSSSSSGSKVPIFPQDEAFVMSGITQVNFTIPLYGLFFLNRQLFKEYNQITPFVILATLGNYELNMTVTDLVTQKSLVKDYYGSLQVWIIAYPPF